MNLLLDTHALLWIVAQDRRLTENARTLFLDTSNTILFSVAGIWELAIKRSLGKIELSDGLSDFVHKHILGNDIGILSIRLDHLYQIENLPFHHRDPFDRLIIAQALVEKIPILSADESFDFYPVNRIWE
jgi:PIN domain nuclease of toxin-antitoxin system